MFSFIKRHKRKFLALAGILSFFVTLVFASDNQVSWSLFYGFIAGIIISYLILSWLFSQIRGIRQLRNERGRAELMMLKSQVNPHFFFNTLNNLYGLTVEKSDLAPKVVLKISDMMRYTIYEGKKDFVPLAEELEYLKNFIELHEMRYHKKVDIQFNHQILDEDGQVTPLLFIILLENAFKHGVESLTKDAYIHISLIAGNGKVAFAIENNFDPSEQSNEPGIGLENLKRRLELIYPKKHGLSLLKKDHVYQAQLQLDIQ
jgi:LytS/YehU family sensor histidine kinase